MPMNHAVICKPGNFFGGKLKYKDLLFSQRNGNDNHTSYTQPFNWKSTFLKPLKQKLELPSLLLGYYAIHICMLLWNGIDPISEHSTSMSKRINELQQNLQ